MVRPHASLSALVCVPAQDMQPRARHACMVASCTTLTAVHAGAQYKGLAELQEKYKRKGFEVLAFPCNQFGSQEPGAVAAPEP